MYKAFNRTNRSYVKFPDKGVEIYIPPQENYTKVSARVVLPVEWDRIRKFTQGYEPGREVINFELVDNAGKVIGNFSPPIELKVYFTVDDVKFVGGNYEDLNLAFLPEGSPQWIIFTEQKHDLKRHLIDHWPDAPPTDPDSWVGYFIVKIEHWGDPSVSVGR